MPPTPAVYAMRDAGDARELHRLPYAKMFRFVHTRSTNGVVRHVRYAAVSRPTAVLLYWCYVAASTSLLHRRTEPTQPARHHIYNSQNSRTPKNKEQKSGIRPDFSFFLLLLSPILGLFPTGMWFIFELLLFIFSSQT